MPITDIIIVCLITSAFMIFAAALAWGDRQTREIARNSRQRALTDAQVVSLKRSAESKSVERNGSTATKTSAEA